MQQIPIYASMVSRSVGINQQAMRVDIKWRGHDL